MKIYGHPWSINTRKVLMTLAEKGHEAELVLVMIPKGEHKQPEHIARHPFGKVPVLADGEFLLCETQAINRYLDRSLSGPALRPTDPRGQALVDEWIGFSDAYFAPHAGPFLVESLFRRYLGGAQNTTAIAASREGMQLALDTLDRHVANHAYLAGTFSIADLHWMPYLEYLVQLGDDSVSRRPHLSAWWQRVSQRDTWQRVARRGPQPYEANMTADVVEKSYR